MCELWNDCWSAGAQLLDWLKVIDHDEQVMNASDCIQLIALH